MKIVRPLRFHASSRLINYLHRHVAPKIFPPTSAVIGDYPNGDSQVGADEKSNLVHLLLQKKNSHEVRLGAAAFHRYLKISIGDTNTSLTLPILDKLWRHLRDEDKAIERWSPEITAEILFAFGRINLRWKNCFTIRRILNRDDIRLMENNLIVNEFQLPFSLITKCCNGLMRLQMWSEVDDDDYPSKEFTSGLKNLLNKEISNESSKNPSIIVSTKNFGLIAAHLSRMNLRADPVFVRCLEIILQKLSTFLLNNDDILVNGDDDDQKKNETSISEFQTKRDNIYEQPSDNKSTIEISQHQRQRDNLRTVTDGLHSCAIAMMNWRLSVDETKHKELWRLWFICCDEILMRIIRFASSSSTDVAEQNFSAKSEIQLISSMIASAICFANEVEVLEMLDPLELRLHRLAPSVTSKQANALLLQMKTLENKVIHSKNRKLKYYDRFSSDLKQKLRLRCTEKDEL